MLSNTHGTYATQSNVPIVAEWLGDGHSEKKIMPGHSFTAPCERTLNAREHVFMAT